MRASRGWRSNLWLSVLVAAILAVGALAVSNGQLGRRRHRSQRRLITW